MTPTTTTTSIADAVMLLHNAPDGHGFRPTEIKAGAVYAGQIEMGLTLTPSQLRSLHRKLLTYREQLQALGVTALQAPPAEVNSAPVNRPAAPATVKIGVLGEGAKARLFTVTPYSSALSQTMKAIAGGEFHGPKKCKSCQAGTGNCQFRGMTGWHYPVSAIAADALRAAVADYTVANDQAYADLLARADASKGASAFRIASELPDLPHLKTKAWLHQKQAYWFAIARDFVQLDMDMGTGKSLTAVALIAAKAVEAEKAGRRPRIIIFCPSRVVGVWPKQFRIHADKEFHVVEGRATNRKGEHVAMKIADRVEEFEFALNECQCGKPHVVMANYEITAHEPFASWGKRQDWDVMVLDESHKVKSPTGTHAKYVAAIGERARFRMGLTGTLMPHSPMDVFSQMRALDPAVFGKTMTKFKNRYMEMGGFGGKQVMGLLPDMEGEFARVVSDHTYRVGAEVLDLPETVPDVEFNCTLTGEAAQLYGQIESSMFAEILQANPDGEVSEDTITADNVLVKMLRLQQIAGGALKLDPKPVLDANGDPVFETLASGDLVQQFHPAETIVFKDQPKAKLLEDLLEDIDPGKPVVVFCKFRNDLDQVRAVAEKLGRKYGELSGRRADALTRDATLSESVQVAGVQIQSGGTGVDLTRSHYAVYYSLNHSLGDYLQSRKRLNRPGQVESVRFIHLVAEGTIDQAIYRALEARESVAKHVGALIRARQEGNK